MLRRSKEPSIEDAEKAQTLIKAQTLEFAKRAQVLARNLEAKADDLNRELGHG